MLDKLKRFDPEAGDIDEAIALAAFARILTFEYQTRGLETPTWVSEKRQDLDGEITRRHRDYLIKELRAEESRLEGLKTAAEKREDAKARIDRLKLALGQAPAPTPNVTQP